MKYYLVKYYDSVSQGLGLEFINVIDNIIQNVKAKKFSLIKKQSHPMGGLFDHSFIYITCQKRSPDKFDLLFP